MSKYFYKRLVFFMIIYSKPCFEVFATQQMPKNWRTRKNA